MRTFPAVHWAEGMFLRPQHLQMFSRQIGGLVSESRRQAQPFYWGIWDIEVAEDQLEAGSFALRAFSAVFKDGTSVELPTNLRVDPRELGKALDAADGPLVVYLGVPLLREGEANTVSTDGDMPSPKDLRFRVDSVEASDENLGGSPHPVEVRKLNARLFFGNEDREGYECLPIAAIERAGTGRNLPVPAESFIPPVLDVAAWPVLQTLAESVANRVEAKYRFLRAEVSEGRTVLDAEGPGGWQPILKLQTVGSFLHVLRQLTALPGCHPFGLYVELTRLAGELSIFEEDDGALAVPLYDHDRLGACFRQLVYTVEQLLERILTGQFVRIDFEVRGELLVAKDLKPEWLAEHSDLYLCIESELSEREIQSRIEIAKLGAPSDLPELTRRRLFGLDIELLKRTPAGLPARSTCNYYAIAKEGHYWRSVSQERMVAISGGIDPKLRFSLYVVLPSERGAA